MRKLRVTKKSVKSQFAVVAAVSILALLGFIGCAEWNQPAAAQTQQKAQAKGLFRTAYPPVKSQKYAEMLAALKKERVLEELADGLNQTIILPTNITLTFAECKEINAFYDPQRQQISICYELLEHFEEAFKPDAKTEQELDDAIVGATVFVFFHELGHALTHVLDLPVTGKEEDAVDQLSTFILADGTDENERAILTAAQWFLLEDQQGDTDIKKLAFWDEHSLGTQRFYNMICWLYGHDSKTYAGLVKNGVLPKDRAVRCADEYAKLEKSWSRLLEPYLK
jgi:hypothetical protein